MLFYVLFVLFSVFFVLFYVLFVLFSVFFVLFYVFLCCSMYCLFCVVLCIVCVYMCTVLLPPGGYPIAVNKYIIYHIMKGHHQEVGYRIQTLWYSFVSQYVRCHVEDGADARWWQQFCG